VIPLAIVAHPLRIKMARALADQVSAEAIVVDSDGEGAGVNHLGAWRWLQNSRGYWGVVLEDDAVPVDDFRDQLDRALAVAPTPIVSLYLGRGRPPKYQDAIARVIAPLYSDPHWLVAAHLFHGVGYAVRHDLIESLLKGVEPLLDDLPIDDAISVWAQQSKHHISYTRPSLVNHRDLATLITQRVDGEPRTEMRVAWLCDSREWWGHQAVALRVGDEHDDSLRRTIRRTSWAGCMQEW
jgi:hypothetical protein